MSALPLLALLATGQAWRASTAPGPVNKAHEKIEGDCDSCHMPFKGLPNEKCVTCHSGLKQFHAGVAAQKCVSCHGEHKGAAGDLTKPQARASFDHAKTAMPLVGAHQKIACETCHQKPLAQLGNSCAGCHKDPHQGALGAACSGCHASTAWKPVARTKEQHKLSMAGGHAGAQCSACHAKGKNLTATVACSACHEQAHGGTTAACEGCHEVNAWKPAKFDHGFCTCFLPQKHQTVGCLGCHQGWKFTNTPTVCSGCHEKERKHESLGECSLCHSAVSWKKNQFDHNKRSKMKLAGEHLKVACENCHLDGPREPEPRPDGRGPAIVGVLKFRGVPMQCESCHAKKGLKAHGDFGPCAKCHTTDGFAKSTFDHASTGFSLTGRHAKVGCKECHEAKKAELPSLRGAIFSLTVRAAPHASRSACASCHADPHQGSVAGECGTCHGTEAWKPSSFDVTRHAATQFPLTGKHAQTTCALCHGGPKLNEAPKECASCHVDRHRGMLGAACEKCHETSAFKPAVGFDHGITGFKLVGGHAQVACAGCHDGPRGKAMRASQAPQACTTCHGARHGRELGADCASCHDPAKGPFAAARGMAFAHEKTGFPLERRHATQACSSCHPAKGPAPGPRCDGCHIDPHSGQLGLLCEDCHKPDRFRLARFDHDRTGWALQGKHFVTPCASCHTGQRWVGLTSDCWDCHAADAAQGRAMRPAEHPFGPLECSACHASQWKWR